MVFTKAQAKSLAILDVARSLGMDMKRHSHKEYYWTEHDSFKINTHKNTWQWYSRGTYGDTINLVQEVKGVSYREAMHYLETGTFPEVKPMEEVRQPFRYTLAPYEQPFNEARSYLKEVRGLSDSTIDFFLEKGVLAQARRRGRDGFTEDVLVFKYLDNNQNVVGASLQGLSPYPDRYEGKGYLKQIMYQSEGIAGLNVVIGSPKRLIVAEAPIDLMSYYELHQGELEDVRLVAMEGLKEGIVSRYAIEALQEQGVLVGNDHRDYTKASDLTKTSQFLANAAQTSTFFHDHKQDKLITLAVDNDTAGTDFLEDLREKKIPVIDARPPKGELQEKMDWNDYLKVQKEERRKRGFNRFGNGLALTVDHIPRIREEIEKYDKGQSLVEVRPLKAIYSDHFVLLHKNDDGVRSIYLGKSENLTDKGTYNNSDQSLIYLYSGEGKELRTLYYLLGGYEQIPREDYIKVYGSSGVNVYKTYDEIIQRLEIEYHLTPELPQEPETNPKIDGLIQTIASKGEGFYIWHDYELEELGASDEIIETFHNRLENIQYNQNGVHLYVEDSVNDGATGYLSLEGNVLDSEGIRDYLEDSEISISDQVTFLTNLEIAVEATWDKVVEHYDQVFNEIVSEYHLQQNEEKAIEEGFMELQEHDLLINNYLTFNEFKKFVFEKLETPEMRAYLAGEYDLAKATLSQPLSPKEFLNYSTSFGIEDVTSVDDFHIQHPTDFKALNDDGSLNVEKVEEILVERQREIDAIEADEERLKAYFERQEELIESNEAWGIAEEERKLKNESAPEITQEPSVLEQQVAAEEYDAIESAYLSEVFSGGNEVISYLRGEYATSEELHQIISYFEEKGQVPLQLTPVQYFLDDLRNKEALEHSQEPSASVQQKNGDMKYLHRIDIDGGELTRESGSFSTIQEAHDFLLTHFIQQLDRGYSGEGYFKTYITLTFVNADGEIDTIKDRLDVGLSSGDFTPNHQSLSTYLNKTYADYFYDRNLSLSQDEQVLEQEAVVVNDPRIKGAEVERVRAFLQDHKDKFRLVVPSDYSEEHWDTLMFGDDEKGYYMVTTVPIDMDYSDYPSAEDFYVSETAYDLPIDDKGFEYEVDDVPILTLAVLEEEFGYRSIRSEKRALESSQEQTKKEGTNVSWGSLQPKAEGSPAPVAESSTTFEQTVTSHPTISPHFLHFTTDNAPVSTIREGYHIATEEDLRNLNAYAPILQQTAQWYLNTLAGSSVTYVYQEDGKVDVLKINYDKDKFMHLTGIRPIGKNLTAERLVERFAAGDGHFANILVNRGFISKAQVLPLFEEIIQAKSFVFTNIADIKKMKAIHASSAIRTENEQLLLAFKTLGDISFPVSTLNLTEPINLQLVTKGTQNAILGVYRERNGVIEQLSINDEYIQDGGKELLTILKEGNLEAMKTEILKEETASIHSKIDSDGDGILDEEELKQGTNPYDFRSTPSSKATEEMSILPEEIPLASGSLAVADFIKNKDIAGLNRHLKDGIKEYLNSDKYKNYLTKMSQLNNYSSRNLRLILAQNSEATHVASFKQWKETFGRHVKKGEKSLRIFAPMTKLKKDENNQPVLDKHGKPETVTFFGLVPVFDVIQTDGKEMPKAISEVEEQLTDVDYANLYRALMGIAKENDASVRFEEMIGEKKGYYNPTEHQIVLRSNDMNKSQLIKTFLHETAHSELHHANNPQKEELTRSTAELQAESVAYVVSSYYGLDTSDYSFGYLESWSDDKETLADLEAQLDIVQQEAKSLMVRMDQQLEQLRLAQEKQAKHQFEQKLQKFKDQTNQAVEEHKQELKQEAQSKKDKVLSR